VVREDFEWCGGAFGVLEGELDIVIDPRSRPILWILLCLLHSLRLSFSFISTACIADKFLVIIALKSVMGRDWGVLVVVIGG